MKTEQNKNKAALAVSAFLILSALCSLLYLALPDSGRGPAAEGYTAEIYQDGRLLYSITLNDISESCTFTVENPGGGVNEIEVRPGSIGVISADCPDKLCVRQGFVADAKLPVTCLPNRLVIILRPVREGTDSGPGTPDISTY